MGKTYKIDRCRLTVIEDIIEDELDTTGYTVRYKNGTRIGVVEVSCKLFSILVILRAAPRLLSM